MKTSLVQLVERRFPKPNAVGSSPTGRVVTRIFYIYHNLKSKFYFYTKTLLLYLINDGLLYHSGKATIVRYILLRKM